MLFFLVHKVLLYPTDHFRRIHRPIRYRWGIANTNIETSEMRKQPRYQLPVEQSTCLPSYLRMCTCFWTKLILILCFFLRCSCSVTPILLRCMRSFSQNGGCSDYSMRAFFVAWALSLPSYPRSSRAESKSTVAD